VKKEKDPKTKRVTYKKSIRFASINIDCGKKNRNPHNLIDEIQTIIERNDMDVVNICESDFSSVEDANDFHIPNFQTILPLVNEKAQQKVRNIMLIRKSLEHFSSVKTKFMSAEFPSIWIELAMPKTRKIMLSGMYREWSNSESSKSIEDQRARFNIYTDQ